MGLLKTIEHEGTGVTITYWNIHSIYIDKDINRIVFAGFIDKTARDAGKKAVATKELKYYGTSRPITKDTLIDGDNLAYIYNKVVQTVPTEDTLSSRFFVGCEEL